MQWEQQFYLELGKPISLLVPSWGPDPPPSSCALQSRVSGTLLGWPVLPGHLQVKGSDWGLCNLDAACGDPCPAPTREAEREGTIKEHPRHVGVSVS